MGLSRIPDAAALAWARSGIILSQPLDAIKRVPSSAKFVIRALKPQTAIRHFDRLEAP